MWEESHLGSPAILAPAAFAGGLACLSRVRTGWAETPVYVTREEERTDSRAIRRSRIFFFQAVGRQGGVCVCVCVCVCVRALLSAHTFGEDWQGPFKPQRQ